VKDGVWLLIKVPVFFSFQVLDSEIIYARDYDYNYFGFKVMYNLLLHKFESDIKKLLSRLRSTALYVCIVQLYIYTNARKEKL